MKKYRTILASPLGALSIETQDGKLYRLQKCTEDVDSTIHDPLAREVSRQLEEYFQGKRISFDLPLSWVGTAFQQKVWYSLQNIPYGETRSYGEIAKAIGHPQAARAIGMANRHNPLWIVVPCHRVIGANGKLTGYAGGLEIKAFLLELERRNRPN